MSIVFQNKTIIDFLFVVTTDLDDMDDAIDMANALQRECCEAHIVRYDHERREWMCQPLNNYLANRTDNTSDSEVWYNTLTGDDCLYYDEATGLGTTERKAA